MPRTASALAFAFLLLPSVTSAAEEVKQSLKKGDVLIVKSQAEVPAAVKQDGKLGRHKPGNANVGLVFETGKEITANTKIMAANSVATTIAVVKGQGTHVRYTGQWVGDGGGGYPILVLEDGGKMTWEAESNVDFVMASNFFTRQLWVQGDNTGTLELAEGFVSDKTEDATVPNAMGTIRLGGATLITHHSQSLPYNSRPDGRGGIYHNGHVVFEHQPGSTWVIKSNQHIYSAQVDFDIDGTIDCQVPFTHNGQRRVCLQVGNGGPFVSTGAFRTTSPDVTITKTGPAMLSLDGQQSYKPGSKLVIAEGLVRMHTDPGAGAKVAEDAGPFLEIEIKPGASLHLAADARLKSIHVHPGGKLSVEKDVNVEVTGSVALDAGATFDGEIGNIKGGVEVNE